MADSSLGYTGFMPEDPSSPPPSDTNASPGSEPPNRPEPVAEPPVSASESASSQTEQPKAEASEVPPPPASESAGSQPSQASDQQPAPSEATPSVLEPLNAPETSSEEPVSMSTSSQTEPSDTTPPAQNVPPEPESLKVESQTTQAATEPQSNQEPEAQQPQNQEVTPPPATEPAPSPSAPPAPSIPSLHYPFYGSSSVAFEFGAQPTDEKIKKKYEEWGIVGHNGIDFGLQEDTEVLACDDGVVTQAGDNGDFGISVTIKHSWGTSIYSHLQSLGVLVNDHVSKAQVIGASGKTGFTTGPHLHFGIQPNNPDTNNGYLGFINPAPYLTETSPLPQSPQSPVSPPLSQSSDLSPDLSVELTLPPRPPVSPQPPQSSEPSSEPTPTSAPPTPPNPSYPPVRSPSVDQEEIQKQAVAMFDARLKENSIKGNQAKKAKRDEAIQKIFSFAQEKKRITNEQIRDLLHVSQSTATDYLSDLVNHGMLKTEGKGRATVYVF